MFKSEREHRINIFLIARGHDHHIRKDSEISEVIRSVMSGSVRTDQSGPIKTKYNRQVLERNFLENLVIGPLQESTININDRSAPAFAMPAAKATAWLSQMPTSKNWFGNVSRIF